MSILEQNENEKKDLNENIKKTDLINNDEIELFIKVLNKELVLELYSIFKAFEKKGLINYNVYIESMSKIFKKYNKVKDYDFKNIFDSIFNRFQKIKCIMKNNKKVFYLTNMLPENKIETYKIVCFLTIFIKCRIIDKIKLLFELTDVDDDGFLNKNEIKQMISTINFMFSEENSLININSSILAQSLMNIRIKEKINSLMNEPGNLNDILEKEKYVNFDTFYNSLIKIGNYKYEIIPCFINMKQCLNNKRSEKILEIKNQNKKEFVRVSSALSSNKPSNPFKAIKRNFSANNLGRIIKNVKINKNIDHPKLIKKKKLLLGIREKKKTFKQLLKESSILSEEENDVEDGKGMNSLDEMGISSASQRISFHTTAKDKPIYIFEADFDKIKKIEVEPALLKFSDSTENVIKDNNLIRKKKGRYHSSLNIRSKDRIKRNYFNENFGQTSAYDGLINLKKYINTKKSPINFLKRSSLFQLHNNNLFKNFNNFNLNKENKALNIYNNISNNSNSISSSKITYSSRNINKFFKNNNNIKKYNEKINNLNKSNTKVIKSLFSPINHNINKINTFKKKLFQKNENKNKRFNKLIESIKPKQKNFSFNGFRNKNLNNAFGRSKKHLDSNKRLSKYMANEIFKDVEKNEEKLKHERTEFIGRELVSMYKKMIVEKKEVKRKIGEYDEYDLSLNFFELNKIKFPKDYGKSIYSFNKY